MIRRTRKPENTEKRVAVFTRKVLALGGEISDHYHHFDSGEVLFNVSIPEDQKPIIESWPMVYQVIRPPKVTLNTVQEP